MTDKRIIILTTESKRDNLLIDTDYPSQLIHTLDDFLPNECLLLAVDLQGMSPWRLVRQIRKIPKAELIPLFYIGPIDSTFKSLFDGELDQTAIKKAEKIHKRIEQIV